MLVLDRVLSKNIRSSSFSESHFKLITDWVLADVEMIKFIKDFFSAQDADKLGGGYVLVFIYVNLMLSKMNFVQQRFWLSVIGILRFVEFGLLTRRSDLHCPVSPWEWSLATASAPCSACSTPQLTPSSPSYSSGSVSIISSSSPRLSILSVGLQALRCSNNNPGTRWKLAHSITGEG